MFDRLGSQEQELPGLLPPLVQDKEGHYYTFYHTHMGGMTDSYYEVRPSYFLLPQFRT